MNSSSVFIVVGFYSCNIVANFPSTHSAIELHFDHIAALFINILAFISFLLAIRFRLVISLIESELCVSSSVAEPSVQFDLRDENLLSPLSAASSKCVSFTFDFIGK